MKSMLPQKSPVTTMGYGSDCVKIEHSNGGSVGGTMMRGSRSKAELHDLMETLQRRKSALEASLRASAESTRTYLSLPPPSPLSPTAHGSAERPLSSRGLPYMTSSSMPPSPRQGERSLSPNSPYTCSRHQSQDSLLLSNSSDGRRPPVASSLLSMWNGSSSYGEPAPRPPRGHSGAASMPSSPRLGRRLYAQGRNVDNGMDPAPRQRKYSTGSLNGLGSTHSRSLPRLHRSADSPALSLPPRRSMGSHRGEKVSVSLSSKSRRSLFTLERPPDVTVPATASVPGTPRRASLASLGCELEGGGLQGSSPCLDLGLGERRLSFGKGGLGPGSRRGSISSLNGKEELRDYHMHQRDERLREQEVQRLEHQRLETILSLCTELGRVERDQSGSAVSDLQKINKELEKLQVSDDESVFSDSPGSISGTAPENGFGTKAEEYQLAEERQVRERRHSGHREARDARSQSPALSLRSSGPSPSPSPHHRAKDVHLKQEVSRIEEERIQVLNNIEEVEQKIKDLDNQMEESIREMEVERALLEGEEVSEMALLQREKEVLDQLNEKIGSTDKTALTERSQEKALLDAERVKVERLAELVSEQRTQLDNCPEALQEQLKEHLSRDVEVLEAKRKWFEDLEFQQLERESRQDEEKEGQTQHLLREIADYQRSTVTRKERLLTLKKQSTQITQQSQREKDSFLKEKNNLLLMLQRERENLASLERKYAEVTGGQAFPNNPVAMKEHFRSLEERRRGSKENSSHLSDTLRKRSQQPLSHYSSSTLGRSLSSKSHLPLSQSSSCGSAIPRGLSVSPRDLESQRLLKAGHSHLYMSEDRQRLVDLCSRTVSESNVFLDPFHYTDNGHAFDTLSADSSDSMETSISACSPDNISSASTSNVAKIEEMERLLREAQADKNRLLEHREREMEVRRQALEEERRRREDLEKRLQEETSRRQKMIEREVKLREKQRAQARPMTRYLPQRKDDFDLHGHIEAAGHNPDNCYHLAITDKTCRGFLVKMGGKIKTWKKRWFVFDRSRRTLAYYADKHEAKMKGVIYFQAIEEVYYDHLKNAHKSPNPSLTFSVKTHDRVYYMVSPSPEAMRIWMDVIVTGAEGYMHFMV
ncbi:pleckstrin homology-like domain family B member 2 isoform X1 [Coregonus clupeaformis]|uniref:pleckstrin homology-like domain family B member 2 isoform X1 n=1 Tax=Coregonus clupeaformis TaxID=59861 RepID=UPI001BE09917|nr:pleckstrin homology-like domain family B member 2 isoform X1 [Coregonus clupeaformis]XP_041750170.1 pleckstrin homology-like domain family B member 2 isoform X1 [Coregonus clupeaformis]XP_041750171.1 pleckstrin homology-like domain family B member 2 isoform X1 [Coregonus clupeaformis]XP_041750172.1 pleckstrin homology-like domain family B member 2 isoform X1 [Coregonus clupeaformis]